MTSKIPPLIMVPNWPIVIEPILISEVFPPISTLDQITKKILIDTVTEMANDES